MTSPRWRAAALGLALAAAGLAPRLPRLGAVPTPAGDEGNWALLGLRLHDGVRARLSDDAAFVTAAFGHAVAWSFRCFGASWAAARAVPVAAVLAAMAASVAYARRLGDVTAGVAVALTLALHPWSVLWSRTVSVPYALSLALATVGPLAWLDAQRARSPWRALAASQLLGVGLHFSPLAVAPIAACAAASFGPERPRGWRLVASLSGALHALPVARGVWVALHVGRQGAPPPDAPLTPRLASMARMTLEDLAGTSTLTHFTGAVAWRQAAGVAVGALLLAASLSRARGGGLAGFAARYLAVACAALPVMLVPGRAWHMPVIDADRYGFALVAPLALGLGAMASAPRWRAVAGLALAWFAASTLAVGWHFARGGGGDQGLVVADGGGRYRGWQAPASGAALPDQLRDAALEAAAGEAAVIAYGDYAFHALRFSIAAARAEGRLAHRIGDYEVAPGRRVFVVTWAPEAFAPGFEPAVVARDAAALRAMAAGRFGASVIRQWRTADGRPLCALWMGRAPATPSPPR